MGRWKCYICKVDMEEVTDIRLRYGDVELPDAPGLRCPVCGQEFLESDYVVQELASAEAMLSGK